MKIKNLLINNTYLLKISVYAVVFNAAVFINDSFSGPPLLYLLSPERGKENSKGQWICAGLLSSISSPRKEKGEFKVTMDLRGPPLLYLLSPERRKENSKGQWICAGLLSSISSPPKGERRIQRDNGSVRASFPLSPFPERERRIQRDNGSARASSPLSPLPRKGKGEFKGTIKQ
jgi:hypothetical protein